LPSVWSRTTERLWRPSCAACPVKAQREPPAAKVSSLEREIDSQGETNDIAADDAVGPRGVGGTVSSRARLLASGNVLSRDDSAHELDDAVRDADASVDLRRRK
jgi:hypothetical protein